MNRLAGFFLIMIASVFATSCDEMLEDLTCDHCAVSAPYSNNDTQLCYDLQSDCESATGSTCVYCTP